MDPNAAWKQLLREAKVMQKYEDDGRYQEEISGPNAERMAQAACDMADIILGLQEWLDKGGFPPEAFKTPKGSLSTDEMVAALTKTH